jgi:hypothetical protein
MKSKIGCKIFTKKPKQKIHFKKKKINPSLGIIEKIIVELNGAPS